MQRRHPNANCGHANVLGGILMQIQVNWRHPNANSGNQVNELDQMINKFNELKELLV